MRNRPPIIEIHGTGTHNRGAQLMAMAIRERLSIDFPGVELVVSVKFGTLQEIADHGFRTT